MELDIPANPLLCYITLMKGGFFQRHARAVVVLSAGFLLAIAVVGFGYGVMELTGQAR